MFLDVKLRPPSTGGDATAEESYTAVMDPVLLRLMEEGQSFLKTIVYLPLKWCGVIHHRFLVKYLGCEPDVKMPPSQAGDLIAQYHAPQSQSVSANLYNSSSCSLFISGLKILVTGTSSFKQY